MRIEINKVVTQERKPAWRPLTVAQEAADAQGSDDTEKQYAGDWNKPRAPSGSGRNQPGGSTAWADAPMDDSWDAFNSGWAPARDHSDVRYRDLLGAVFTQPGDDDEADALPEGGFFRGADEHPVAAVPGNALQQDFAAAVEPGELEATPEQFNAQRQREQEVAAQREEERQQRTAMLEEQAKQQHQDTLQQQREVRLQQEAQSAELARQTTVARSEATAAAEARTAVNAKNCSYRPLPPTLRLC